MSCSRPELKGALVTTQSMASLIRNRLLQQLQPEDMKRLEGLLQPVALNVNDVLITPNKPIEYAYFVEQGLCSVIAISKDDQRIEVGDVGREGFSGTPIVLDVDSSPHLTFVQIAGSALRITSSDMREVIDRSPAFRNLLLRYVHTMIIQVGHTALSNGRAKIETRLARWILMCHDRLDGDEVPLTHQFLALMLGVRRSGVTTALHVLEGEHVIRATRGRVLVLDRARLIAFAADTYGVPEDEYERVVGVPMRHA
jgi:CRP-like cAMP-binding protein